MVSIHVCGLTSDVAISAMLYLSYSPPHLPSPPLPSPLQVFISNQAEMSPATVVNASTWPLPPQPVLIGDFNPVNCSITVAVMLNDEHRPIEMIHLQVCHLSISQSVCLSICCQPVCLFLSVCLSIWPLVCHTHLHVLLALSLPTATHVNMKVCVS